MVRVVRDRSDSPEVRCETPFERRRRDEKWDDRKAYVKERSGFKSLLLTNSNYFGKLLESPLDPVLKISGNTFYEELACVGYHPEQEQLEGVVYVYHPSGYGTDICGPGTPEYVRFYLSYDGGNTWEDQGITSFQAYNIPEGTEGGRFLEYAARCRRAEPGVGYREYGRRTRRPVDAGHERDAGLRLHHQNGGEGPGRREQPVDRTSFAG